MKAAAKESVTFHLFILPWLIGFFGLTIIPLLFSFYVSFSKWNGIGAPHFIGLRNFRFMFLVDDRFWQSMKNTFYYTFASVPLMVALALLLAVLLNRKLPGSNFFRSVFYLPSVIAGVSIYIVWAWMYDPKVGIFNYLLSFIGIKGPFWLLDEHWSMPSLIIMSLTGCGGSMLIFLAGLQGVPKEYYEAARMDGANSITQFIRITLPLLGPTVFFNTIMGLIFGLQVFSQPFIMTQGGPYYSTYVIGLHIYNNAFRFSDFGYAASLSWILFLVILALSGAFMRATRRLVFFEGGT
jgi:multiple sugar transport system permease protein